MRTCLFGRRLYQPQPFTANTSGNVHACEAGAAETPAVELAAATAWAGGRTAPPHERL